MENPKIVYYKDELNDEFSGDDIVARKIDKDYVYLKNSLWYRFVCFFWYRIVATPLVALYMKLKFRHKVIGKRKIRKCKSGAFLFGNHTHSITDISIPTLVSFPKKAYIIAHANNVSIKYIKNITPKIGAVPLPDDIAATKNFTNCLNQRFKEKSVITIYPEAHIWPYCTVIRPFTSASFRYPVMMDGTTYCLTNTYQKRKFSKKPRMVTYIDGPFYPDKELPRKEAQQKLRDEIYNTMVERSKLNTLTLVKYVKEE